MNSAPQKTLFGTIVLFFGLISCSQAASIVWDTPITISGDTDVSISGTFVSAYNLGSTTSVALNGITFAGTSGTSGASYQTGFGSGEGSLVFSASVNAGSGFGGSATPYTSLSTNYKTLLNATAYFGGAGASSIFTLQNLVIGKQYTLQLWTHDGRAFSGRSTSFTAGNAVTLDVNTTDLNGGLGQSVIGTFTADATTQSITWVGVGNSSYLNALSLSSPIPEPSTYAILMGTALLGMAALRRRRAI